MARTNSSSSSSSSSGSSGYSDSSNSWMQGWQKCEDQVAHLSHSTKGSRRRANSSSLMH
jgi:hypothetical protein